MKLKGRISILINRDGTTIEVEDENSNTRFVEIKLTPDQLSAALSRQACIECELEVKGLDHIGKKHECKSFKFEVPESVDFNNKYKNNEYFSNQLRDVAQSKLTDGWIAEDYFNSQNSFFKKNGKQWARCTIRRWI